MRVDFIDSERVFAGPTFTFEDDREALLVNSAWVSTLGLLGMKVIVRSCIRETEDEIALVISMREAMSNDGTDSLFEFTNL